MRSDYGGVYKQDGQQNSCFQNEASFEQIDGLQKDKTSKNYPQITQAKFHHSARRNFTILEDAVRPSGIWATTETKYLPGASLVFGCSWIWVVVSE